MRAYIVCLAVSAISCAYSMQVPHQWLTCHEQEKIGGCAQCCSTYPDTWQRYSDSFGSCQQERTDKLWCQYAATNPADLGITGSSVRLLKSLKDLYKRKVISAKTYSTLLKIRAYKGCLQSMISAQRLYSALAVQDSHNLAARTKAKLIGDTIVHKGSEMGAWYNWIMFSKLKLHEVALSYLEQCPGHLHMVLPLLKMFRHKEISDKSALASTIMCAYCHRYIEQQCVMCNAGLHAFLNAITSYKIPVDSHTNNLAETITGTDADFVRRQGTSALSACTLLYYLSDPCERMCHTQCPVYDTTELY